MEGRQKLWTGTIASLGLAVLILDAKTALYGAREGIELCLYTVLPSLFPFFVLSVLINRSLSGRMFPALRSVGRLCRIPAGAESLLLLGLLGGYPVGAQCIYETYKNGGLQRNDAERMLGFCNNTGPAFIFGMVGSLFSAGSTVWILWAIHIFSALVTGILLPSHRTGTCFQSAQKNISLSEAMEKSTKNIAFVCGWVIIFRVLITFCQRWFLWIFPQDIQTMFIGILELSNGVHILGTLPAQGTRFVMASIFLSLGGICVAMQTRSVTGSLDMGLYFLGKVIQTVLSFLAAGIVQYALFPACEQFTVPFYVYILSAAAGMITVLLLHRQKKVVAICC